MPIILLNEQKENGVIYNAKGDLTGSTSWEQLDSMAPQGSAQSMISSITIRADGRVTNQDAGAATWYDRGSVTGDEGTYGSNYVITYAVTDVAGSIHTPSVTLASGSTVGSNCTFKIEGTFEEGEDGGQSWDVTFTRAGYGAVTHNLSLEIVHDAP